MTYQEKLSELATGLAGVRLENGLSLSTEIVKGDVDVLVVTMEDREEFPIYVTVDESQILCISHLWTEAEVKPQRRAELLDALLTMNVPMPLSSFSKLGKQYLIFGALRKDSTVNDVVTEIEMLSDNTLTAVEEFSEFLIQA